MKQPNNLYSLNLSWLHCMPILAVFLSSGPDVRSARCSFCISWIYIAMDKMQYGRKYFSFAQGATVHMSTSITERALPDESENAFKHRLMNKYGDRQGTVEIIIKNGRPNYAVITFEEISK